MANPQSEDGHIDIANEIAEALMKVNLSAYESRVLWFLFRKTYGWKKKTDWISLSQFSECLCLDKRLVHRAIKELSSKGMIVIERDDGIRVRYGFQKDYEKWNTSSKKKPHVKKFEPIQMDNKESSSKRMMSSKGMITVIERDDEPSSKGIPTKDTITKDTITKDKEQVPDWVPKDTFIEFIEMRRKLRRPLLEKSYPRFFKSLQKLCNETRASPEDIINQSIINSWQGIFPLKTGGNGNGSGHRGSPGTSFLETRGARSDGQPYPADREY
jgi:phage replication O-like protein O